MNKMHNYKEKNFKCFNNYFKKTKTDKDKLDTFNAVLESLNLSKDDYYVADCSDIGYTIYRKDSHNLKINFFILDKMIYLKFEQSIYGEDEKALLELKETIKEDLHLLSKNFFDIPYNIRTCNYTVKKQNFDTYDVYESFIKNSMNHIGRDIDNNSLRMTESEIKSKYKGFYSFLKDYEFESYKFSEIVNYYILINILFHRDFGVRLTEDDFSFIYHLDLFKLDKLNFCNLHKIKEFKEFKDQGVFEFDKDGKLTEYSKKILKINFKV